MRGKERGGVPVRSHAEKHGVEFGNGTGRVRKQGLDFAFIRFCRGLDRDGERTKVELSHLEMVNDGNTHADGFAIRLSG